MAIQNINVGTVANDGTGDDLRTAFGKLNSNFSTSENAASKLMATPAQAIAGTPGVIPDAAGVKSYVDQYGIGGIRDLRSTIYSTGVPSDLYEKGTVFGFADAAELGIAGYSVGSYGTLEVGYQWTDGTGSPTAYRRFTTGHAGGTSEFLQTAISPAAWGPWRLQYNQSNIIGTVSQSGGIPTGAIIETGSNANGFYTKFADGTMICRHTVSTASIACTTADTILGFKSDTQVWTYPATFASVPSYQVNGGVTPAIITRADTTTSAEYVWYSVNSSAATTRYASFLVIGRWY